MSRIGKMPIELPSGVEVKIEKSSNIVTIKGKMGEISQKVDRDIIINVEENTLTVERPTEQKRHKAMHGLYRSLLNNMVMGVSQGFKKQMELVGVGYRATATGQMLELALGFSHPVVFQLPSEIKVMDRIYSVFDSDVNIFKKWAFDNGYIPKWEQNAKSHQFFDIKGEVIRARCTVQLDNWKLTYYPYLDTLPYFNYDNGMISNDEYAFNWDYKLIQATGNLEPERQQEDDEENNDW